MQFEPYSYQQYCINRIIDTPKLGLFLDMGLGKTVITLTALQELKYYRFAYRKALVIAPLKVAESTWGAELKKWEHLSMLRMSVCTGTLKQRTDALRAQADVYVINRENTQWLVEKYGRNWPFDVVVLDESSSFKNHQAKRFRALRSMLPHINRIIELTGTPSPHGLMDLWSQVYLLDGGQRLGRTISVYRDIYFVPDRRNRHVIFTYAPKQDAPDAIYKAIDDICISMKAEDYLDLPDVIYDDVPVKLDTRAKNAYTAMERDMLLSVDEEVISATTAATLTGKLLQLCNGAVYDAEGNARSVHHCKIDALLETIEQLNGQHAIIYYYFRHDHDRIVKALKDSPLRIRTYTGAQDADAWNAGEIDLLLAQPASCGYGLNLQDGGHHIIWFGLTWSLEEYQQANKRLHRQGQRYPVIIHRLIVEGGLDEEVVHSLSGKENAQEELLEALKARVNKARGEIQ